MIFNARKGEREKEGEWMGKIKGCAKKIKVTDRDSKAQLFTLT